jgi:hypothetical protein
MKRNKWKTFEVIDRVAPSNAVMIVGANRQHVAGALIVGISSCTDELRAAETELFVCDDGWGNCLILKQPVLEPFVEALATALPGARVIPIDFAALPTRRLMTIGRRGVELHPAEVRRARVEAAPNQWEIYGERWGSEWSAARYFAYRECGATLERGPT